MTSSEIFDHIIIGGGPMGAAAAQYLSAAGKHVALLAPLEPARATHGDGMPSSHADLSRVTRRLDGKSVWARLAEASAERYRSLEAQSGISFYTESSCISVVEGSGQAGADQLAALELVGDELQIPYDRLVGADIRLAHPAIRVEPKSTALRELQAGWLNPRAYVEALITVGRQHGLEVVREPMVDADMKAGEVVVTTRSGRTVRGQRILFAMGAYSAFDLPVSDTEKLLVYARTVVHVRLSDEQLHELGDLPSMIVRGTTDEKNCYILPPMRYPDGHWYIKIGGGPRARQLFSTVELESWFQGVGDPVLGLALQRRLEELLPACRGGEGTTRACAITVTDSSLPRIVSLNERSALVSGGNGHAAKSGDEIGRLAAAMVAGTEDWSAGYPVDAFAD